MFLLGAGAVVGLLAIALLLLSPRATPATPRPLPSTMAERVSLTTTDGMTIVGDAYAPPQPSSRGLLLLHMMPATRSSWRPFAGLMQGRGWQVLAIDLRGHGESSGGPEGYTQFSDAEHQASRLDVEAAAAWLQSNGVSTLALGGASIGANLALQYLAQHPEGRAAVLLSPGLSYRGVATEDAARSLRPQQAVYFAASREDMRSSGQSATDMAETLYGLCPASKEIARFDGAGHGTTIFERQPEFMATVADWLDHKLGP